MGVNAMETSRTNNLCAGSSHDQVLEDFQHKNVKVYTMLASGTMDMCSASVYLALQQLAYQILGIFVTDLRSPYIVRTDIMLITIVRLASHGRNS